MSLEPKRTSFMRYARVLEILQGDNALSKKLSKNTAAVCRPDQTHKEFPVEVVYVTDEIHKQGADAATMPVIEVIRTAFRLLIQNPGPIPTPAPLPPPAPKVKAKAPAPKPKAAPAKPVKAAKPPAPKPKEKPKVPRRAPAPKGQATADERPPAVEQKIAGESGSTKPEPVSKPLAFVRQFVPFVVGVAALSNLQAVLTLLEPFVAAGDTEAKEVCLKVNELIDDIHRRTVLPCAEKEPTTPAG